MKLIPTTFNEFRNSKYYVLPSTIKKYQGFLPTAQPIPNIVFKTEQVYNRSDVTELHTEERWKKHSRQVRTNEKPVKKVKGLYNDPERVAELYGFWQTDPFKLTLTADGKIPVNKYGNIEVFNGPLPEGCVHVYLPKALVVCKKLGLEHVPAVVGFEKTQGRSHPMIAGVVTFKKNVKIIEEAASKMEEELRAKEE